MSEIFNVDVSVVVCFYNLEGYILRCLNSLKNQTLENIEFIIIDDGSYDLGSNIAKNFIDEHNNFFYFRQKNKGLGAARNYGISKCKGEFIGFVDGDDYVAPEMYQKMYESVKKNNSDIAVCYHWAVFKNRKKLIKNSCKDNFFNTNILNSPKILDCRSYVWNKIFHNRFFFELGYKFPEGQVFEDSYLIYTILLKARKVSLVEKSLYYYDRTRSNSLSSKVDTKIFDIFHSINKINEEFLKYNISNPKLKEQVLVIILRHILARYRTLHKKEFSQISKDFTLYSFNYLDNNFPDWRLKNVKNKLSLNAYDYFILYFKYVNIFLLQIPKIIRKLIMFFFIFLKIHK